MKYSRSWNIMKRLDLREPGKAEKLKHNQAREMDLVGENEALEELEKRWLMAGNERDWLYDGVKILFPLAPPRQPLPTLNPPPPSLTPTPLFEASFSFFFSQTLHFAGGCVIISACCSPNQTQFTPVQLTDQCRDAQLCLFLFVEVSVSPIMPLKPRMSQKRLFEYPQKRWVLKKN